MPERPDFLRGPGVPVKICGLTRLEDACLAWELGASALGFIFHSRSPRNLPVDAARRIRQKLPPEAVCLGVFVDQPADHVNQVADFVGLEAVQLHGREDAATVGACRRPVVKAVRAEDEAFLEDHPAALLLLDAAHPQLAGGTGLRADWALAARLAVRRPLVLAGGLAPDNIEPALEAVRPHALDVNSGVESAPGVKDAGRLRDLFSIISAIGR